MSFKPWLSPFAFFFCISFISSKYFHLLMTTLLQMYKNALKEFLGVFLHFCWLKINGELPINILIKIDQKTLYSHICQNKFLIIKICFKIYVIRKRENLVNLKLEQFWIPSNICCCTKTKKSCQHDRFRLWLDYYIRICNVSFYLKRDRAMFRNRYKWTG